jgi:hypothetical protein
LKNFNSNFTAQFEIIPIKTVASNLLSFHKKSQREFWRHISAPFQFFKKGKEDWVRNKKSNDSRWPPQMAVGWFFQKKTAHQRQWQSECFF